MQRTSILVLAVIFVFAAVSALMLKLMPEPLKDSDFLVIGTVATLASVLTVFFGLVTGRKGGDTFFKRRRKR